MSSEGKPTVLIIGGLGVVGRHLALQIHKNNLASEVRIVDKQLPQLAWLAPEFVEPCANFMQGDMSRQATVEKAFTREDGSSFDYVFNCGGETKYSQDNEIYRQRILDLAIAAGNEAAKRKVKLFVELSDARVYNHDTTGNKESETPKPWLPLAIYKLMAEEELKKIEGLNLMILRLTHVYGPYATKYVATVLCNARVYQYLNQEMMWLWTKELRINTVHITDTVRAIWDATEWYIAGQKGWDETWGKTPLFNIVDDGDTSQGKLVKHLEEIFNIKAGFAGTLMSQLAKLNLADAVDEANDSVLGPWAELLHNAGITKPGPLSPFLEKELLKDSNLSIDGTRFKDVVGFKYEVPEITRKQLEEMIDSYKTLDWWP